LNTIEIEELINGRTDQMVKEKVQQEVAKEDRRVGK